MSDRLRGSWDTLISDIEQECDIGKNIGTGTKKDSSVDCINLEDE